MVKLMSQLCVFKRMENELFDGKLEGLVAVSVVSLYQFGHGIIH